MCFRGKLPRWVTAVLGIVQIVLTAAIAGLEFGSFYYDVAHGTIWAGFWAAIVYIITFLIMLFMTCCCHGAYCATYALIFNLINAALACLIIYYDSYFLSNLCKCYLGDTICCALKDMNSFNSNYLNTAKNCTPVSLNGVQTVIDYCYLSPPTSKVIFLQAQIGCAGGMLITVALYVISYVSATLGICLCKK